MLRHVLFSPALTLMALAVAISTHPMQGQTMSFFRQFSAPWMDQATAVVADASGIYVIGWGRPGGIRKFDSRGNELWGRETTSTGLGVAADATGVYVLRLGAGGPGPRLVLSKYSPDGNELWTRQLDFFVPGAVAADASGVYVAGRNSSPVDADYLRKYSPDGVELWTRRWGEPNQGFFLRVTVDATGVYVFNLGVPGVSARKWDSGGNELWSRQYPPCGGFCGVAAAEPTGFFLVGAIGLRSVVLNKYDAAGNELWTRQLATSPSQLSPQGLAADGTGVYVVGTPRWPGPAPALPGQCRSGSGGDSFVRKYDPDGVELWTRQFGTSQTTSARGMAVDSSGVYVVGQEVTAPGDWEIPEVFAAINPASNGFLAKFEKTAAVVSGSLPRIFPGCVVNAASYLGGGVAPGEIVTIFSSAMGPSEVVHYRLTEDHKLATTLVDTRILFDGVPAPLVYVSDKQSSAIVPYAVAGRASVDVQVEYKGVQSDAVTMPVLVSRPGIFSLDGSGQGQGAILNEDGSLNSPSNPARRGSLITIFGTGGGEAAPGVEDGQIVSDVLPRTNLLISVFFDVGLFDDVLGVQVRPKPGEVLYAGGSPGSVAGLLQVNVRVPANAALTGDAVPFALIIDSQWTLFQVTLALR